MRGLRIDLIAFLFSMTVILAFYTVLPWAGRTFPFMEAIIHSCSISHIISLEVIYES